MIIINGRFLTQRLTGVQRYAIEIIKCLPKQILGHEIVIAVPKGYNSNKENYFNYKLLKIGKFKSHLWEQFELPAFAKKNDALILNFSGIAPIFYRKKILYLHDLAFKHYPKSFSYLFRVSYNIFIPISIKNSLKVITVSNYVKKDIERNYGISNLEVVYAACSDTFKAISKKKEKIILSVSSLDPRKNLAKLVQAFNLIDTDWKLVLVGERNKSFSEINFLDIPYINSVKFTGYISDEELLQLYNRAGIFVYPSIFEGFGIPPLEAQSCGCPCLISNASCLPEVYKNSVLYCDPNDVNDIKENIEKLINSPWLRENFIQLGNENAKNYSWSFSAKKLTTIIEREL